MATVSGTFGAVGVSSSLRTGKKGENVTVTLTGGASASVVLERATTPDELAWEKVDPTDVYDASSNVTVVYLTVRDQEVLRLRASSYTSGTVTFTLADAARVIISFKDDNSNELYELTESGFTHRGTLTVDGATTLTGALTASAAVTIASTLAVTGDVTFSADLIFDGDNPEIRGGDVNGLMHITPDTTNVLGGRIVLYGSGHGTKADDVEIYGSATLQMLYDDSGSLFDFQANAITTTGIITGATGSILGNLTLADGSITDSGGSISFGDENLSTTGTINSTPVEEGQSVDPSQKVTLFDDFLLTTLDPLVWSDGEGSDDVAVGPAIEAGLLNGAIGFTSGDANNAAGSFDVSGTCGNGLHWQADSGGLVMEARIQVDDITSCSFFVGFTDAVLADGGMEAPIEASGSGNVITAEADDAAGIIFDTNFVTDPTKINLGAVNNTSVLAIVVGAGLPVNDTYVILRVTIGATGTVEGFVNGTSIGTIASAITITDPLTPCVLIRGRTTATRKMIVDYIWCQQDR